MGMTIQLPDWTLNYQVAAFGAWATIFVQSIYLILGGFENASLLSISILTNGSAVLVAGFGGASSTPFAIIRICLTSLFLLCAIILRENETFDGTYAILCSVGHLVYQVRLRHGEDSEGFLPRHEKRAKTDEAPSECCLHLPPTDYNDATQSSRSIRIVFGDSLCLEGAMVPVTIFGTVMTYRVFDFDLGFGLVFAFMSAFLSSVTLLFINYARLRGRRMDTQRALKMLVSMMLVVGIFCFVFFTNIEFPDIEFSWWRIAFGVAWYVLSSSSQFHLVATSDPLRCRFMFLFRTTYVACRFLIHATIFSCAACSQREAGLYGPLTQEASARCMWDDYVVLPALDQEDDASDTSTTFRVRRRKGPDLVERFWLNDQEWFQISPRIFVMYFVSCIVLACFSGGALNPDGSFANIGSHFSKNTAFYLTIAFTFVSTGHTAVEDSPELMFDPLRSSFPDWKTAVGAIVATILVHAYIMFSVPTNEFLILATPLACTIMAPLLLAGISRSLDSVSQQANSEPSAQGKILNSDAKEPSTSTTEASSIDSTMVYSSSRFRCLDLRVLILGCSITLFDVLCNRYDDEMFIARWPTSAVISISVTSIWLYLENLVPRFRELEPGLLSFATVALVSIFSHVNFMDAFGLYDDEWEDENLTHTMPMPEDSSHSKPILIALWYTTLISMVVVNRRLVHKRADQELPATDGQSPNRDHLLFRFHVQTSHIDFAWQLRNSRVAVCLVFTMLAACTGERWPLDMNTTTAGLLLFALTVGFQLRHAMDVQDEKRSMRHIAALGTSALMTFTSVGLVRNGLLDGFVSGPKMYWKAGAWSTFVSYRLFVSVGSWLEGKGWFTGRDPVDRALGGRVEDQEAAIGRGGKKASDAIAEDCGNAV